MGSGTDMDCRGFVGQAIVREFGSLHRGPRGCEPVVLEQLSCQRNRVGTAIEAFEMHVVHANPCSEVRHLVTQSTDSAKSYGSRRACGDAKPVRRVAS